MEDLQHGTDKTHVKELKSSSVKVLSPQKDSTANFSESSVAPDERLFVCDAQMPPSTHLSASQCTTCSFNLHHNTPTSGSKRQPSLKTETPHKQQLAGDDACASLVLACLFCRVEECVSFAAGGLQQCVSCLCSELCSKLCCCDPACLEPILDELPACDPAGCLDSHCCLHGECSVCEFCLHATECLELGMEVSQMLFH